MFMSHELDNENLPSKIIGRDIVLFDGDCVLCHNMVSRLIQFDEDKHFLLCAQQSEIGRQLLNRHHVNVDDLTSMYLIKNCGGENEKLLTRSKAALYAMSKSRKCAFAASLLSCIPPFFLDLGYKFIAANRYRIFGKKAHTCMVPTTNELERILH